MSDPGRIRLPWQEGIPLGKRISVGLIALWWEVPWGDESAPGFSGGAGLEERRRRTAKCRSRMQANVEQLCRELGGALPLYPQGNEVVVVFPAGEDRAAETILEVATLLFQRARVDLDLDCRVGLHGTEMAWDPVGITPESQEALAARDLAERAPVSSMVASEALWLLLPPEKQKEFAAKALTPEGHPFAEWAFVMPKEGPGHLSLVGHPETCDLDFWQAMRAYLALDRISSLRYVGFQLGGRPPPSLRLEEVFEPLECRTRSRRGPRDLREEEERLRDSGEEDSDRKADDASDAKAPERPWDRELEEGLPEVSRPLADEFSSCRSMVVLGDPGAGKSTLLRWLALSTIRGEWETVRRLGVRERLLPVLVSVGTLSQYLGDRPGLTVLEAMGMYFRAEQAVQDEGAFVRFLQRALEAEACLVLLDGLDEVRTEDRDIVGNWLETFAGRYSGNRFVATSRLVGYRGLALPDAREVVLEPFSDPQVMRFVNRFVEAYQEWESHGRRDPGACAREARALLDGLANAPRLGALARNPFLLSGLALIHRAEGRLPRHRALAYHRLSQTLSETWSEARKLVPGPGGRPEVHYFEEAIPVLGQVAREMHEEWPSEVAPKDWLLRRIERAFVTQRGVDKGVAREVAAGFLQRAGEKVQLLYERGPDRWGFLHLTFQEFFAAMGLLAAEEFDEFALKHLFQPRWREVLRLGVGAMAMVNSRPKAAAIMVRRVLEWEEKEDREWITKDLRLQVPIAAILASEAGGALPKDLALEVARKFSSWVLESRGRVGPALDELAHMESPDEFPDPLLGALNDQSWVVRRSAVNALGALRSDRALEPLLAALSDKQPEVRSCAAAALGMLKSERAVEAILRALKDEEPEVRGSAATALGMLESEGAVDALMRGLKDDSELVRTRAAAALGSLKSERGVEPLLGALGDEDPRVRRNAVEALAALKSGRAVEPILVTLGDPDSTVRRSAAAALGALKAERAVKPLVAAMRDSEWTVRKSAIDSLGALKSDLAVESLLVALEDGMSLIRSSAAVALGELNSRIAVDPLVRALEDESPLVRRSAVESLGAIKAETAVEPLLGALKDQNPEVRRSAAGALGAIRSDQSIEPLIGALKDEYWTVRRSAATALGVLRSAAALEPLLGALKDRDTWVCSSAAVALGVLKSERAVSPLLAAFNSGDPEVRRCAAEALQAIAESLPAPK